MSRRETQALFLGIDLGTSGCRAVVIDAAGGVQASARVPLPAPRQDGNRIEQDPALWWQGVQAVLAALRPHTRPEAIRALAVDGTSGTILLTDANGVPQGDALMYNDARAVPQAERLGRLAPAETAAHGASCSLAKLLWLLEHRPAQARAARHALHQADWLVGRLTGQWGRSDANNALKLGYDAVAGRWPDWLGALAVPRRLLPEVLTPGTPLGPLTEEARAGLGLAADTLAVAGTTDSTAAILATGAAGPGEAVTSLGSTLVLKVLCERPVFAPAFGVYSQPLGRLWLAGGGSNSGGAVLRHYFSDAQMAEMTPLLDPERPTGLDYYPLLRPGERFPINDAQLPPRVLPRADDPLRFFQGLLEGIARIEAEGYRRLAELGAPYPHTVRSVGGGAVNEPWTRMRARLLDTRLLPAVQSEAAYGAALLARQGAAAA